jgi:hypothetical protein
MWRAGGLALSLWAAFAWAWLLLHIVSAFFVALREERDLAAEARLLLHGDLCGLPRSFPMSGTLIRCDDARKILRRFPLAAAAERVLATLVAGAAAAARRELTNMLLFVGGALAGLVLLGRRAASGLVADAIETARVRRERAAWSEMQRAKAGVTVPMWGSPPLGAIAFEDDFKED